jgi:hypothetical protein
MDTHTLIHPPTPCPTHPSSVNFRWSLIADCEEKNPFATFFDAVQKVRVPFDWSIDRFFSAQLDRSIKIPRTHQHAASKGLEWGAAVPFSVMWKEMLGELQVSGERADQEGLYLDDFLANPSIGGE